MMDLKFGRNHILYLISMGIRSIEHCQRLQYPSSCPWLNMGHGNHVLVVLDFFISRMCNNKNYSQWPLLQSQNHFKLYSKNFDTLDEPSMWSFPV